LLSGLGGDFPTELHEKSPAGRVSGPGLNCLKFSAFDSWLGRSALRGLLGLYHGNWEAQFHHVIDQHFDGVNPGFLEFDIGHHAHRCHCLDWIGQLELHGVLTQHSASIRCDESDHFGELPDAGHPAVEHAQFESGDRQLRDTNQTDDADQDKIAIGLLLHVLAEERALEIGKDAIRFHDDRGEDQP